MYRRECEKKEERRSGSRVAAENGENLQNCAGFSSKLERTAPTE